MVQRNTEFDMPENYEEFISFTLRTKNSRSPSRILARIWKHQWLPLCFAGQARTVSTGQPVLHPIRSTHNLHVSWKPVNPHDCVWKNIWRIIMVNILQEKRDNSLQHYNLVHKVIPVPEGMKIPAAKAAVEKNGETWKDSGVGPDKSEVKQRWSRKEGRRAQEFILPHWWSSASQMTAAKVMDIISRLPGCAGQAADAVSAYALVKMENSQIGMSRHFDSSTTTQMSQIMVQYGRPSCSSWKESVRSSFGRTGLGKGNKRESCWSTVGRRFSIWEKLIIHSESAGKKLNINPMWKVPNKEVDLLEPTSFFDHVHLECTQRQFQISKDIVDTYRAMFESRISAEWLETSIPSKSSSFSMVLWHGRSCKGMCWAILWVSQQDDATTLQSIYSMHRWPPLERRRNEICRRIVTSML